MSRARPASIVAAAFAALALSACTVSGDTSTGDTSAGDTSSIPGPSADALTGELKIFAAASLSGAFDELATQFEQQHPNLDVAPISYDGSSVLAAQLIAGAPADVFASADEPNMTQVVDAGLAGDPVTFATNTLQIVVAPENPLRISELADLAGPDLTDRDLTVIVCAPDVPCGTASQILLDAAGVALAPASEEQNVTAVLAKVKSGEADAGLVYRTDVAAAGDAVTGIPIDGAETATNAYPLAALDDAANPAAADAFVAFVISDVGQQVLADFGFGAP